MSQQLSLPKLSLTVQKMKNDPKRYIRPFCMKPFSLGADKQKQRNYQKVNK